MTDDSEFLLDLDTLVDHSSFGIYSQKLQHQVILIRKADQIFGWLDACPHYAQGTSLAWKKHQYLNSQGNYIVCFSHGAQFEIETGKCLSGPCVNQYLTPVQIIIKQKQIRLIKTTNI